MATSNTTISIKLDPAQYDLLRDALQEAHDKALWTIRDREKSSSAERAAARERAARLDLLRQVV